MEYTPIDKSKDQLLKRGILDTYELHEDPNRWVILDEYVFWSARFQTIIVIPKWMHTDLASIPRGMRWLIGVNEEHRLASLVHDFGYKLGAKSNLSREDWDLLLRDFCIMFSSPRWKFMSMYLAVRCCGAAAWEREEDMMIPMEHRFHYIKALPKLKLSPEDGKYILI